MPGARLPLELGPAPESMLPRTGNRGLQAAGGPPALQPVRVETTLLYVPQIEPVLKRHPRAGVRADPPEQVIAYGKRHAVRTRELERLPLDAEPGVAGRELRRRGERAVDQLIARQREVRADA